MKFYPLALLLLATTPSAWADPAMVKEVVYVEAPTDTDGDGKLDRVYATIERPASDKKISTIFRISPYALGGTEVPMHNVDVDLLPQDEVLRRGLKISRRTSFKKSAGAPFAIRTDAPRYAQLKAHSVGTGYSTGCPTVGDEAETLAAKAVIDWLNGRAKAFYENGQEAKADWANGNVGMTGTSYDGTLPIMVATTGVEGLKAIVPVAAISNWYDYYRANGLVVNPGGYIGEDADILGYYIVRRGGCKTEMQALTEKQGRNNGDFTPFWQARNYVPQIKNIKAAVFIIHGQSDWNVKQKHAIQLWEALEGVAPRRMFLHKGGHGSTGQFGVPQKLQDWFDHFVDGVDNGITDGPQVEVELPNGELVTQEAWPHEAAPVQRLYFGANGALATAAGKKSTASFTDIGESQTIEKLAGNPESTHANRLMFLTAPLQDAHLLSGTGQVKLKVAVKNRKAANLTVAVVEYAANGGVTVITRGWVDPQNHADVSRGVSLVPGQYYQVNFDLEPKQYRIAAGSRLGVMLASTDYEYTLRPRTGTVLEFALGAQSFIDLRLAPKH